MGNVITIGPSDLSEGTFSEFDDAQNTSIVDIIRKDGGLNHFVRGKNITINEGTIKNPSLAFGEDLNAEPGYLKIGKHIWRLHYVGQDK